ncbi:putative TIR domain-containing protein [Helianthus debilis subsp. tardiflorus]
MASTSSSSIQKSFKYDVFLSFRGEDTRKNFVDYLYHALKQKGIYTYKDDEEIKKGNKISDELIRSIEDSKFYIIVFSKNYASSSWCLDELVKIMQCQKTTNGQTAYPVFYDVEPTEVRKQSGQLEKHLPNM